MAEGKKPQDHKKKATKADALQADIHLEHDGVEYVIRRQDADDLEIFELVEEDKAILATRAFLGDAQWERFKDSQRNEAGRVPLTAFNDFLDALMGAIGGNSSASGGS